MPTRCGQEDPAFEQGDPEEEMRIAQDVARVRIEATVDNGEQPDQEDLDLFSECRACDGLGGDPAGPCRAGCCYGRLVFVEE